MNIPLISNPELLEEYLNKIPGEPGVYFMKDVNGEILYIGKSKKLRSRVKSYFQDLQRLSVRIAMMVRQIAAIEFIATDTEAEALALEANLIKQHHPHYNILLKDDKRYPYICITWSQTYPRIFITRKRHPGNTKDRYYGPYVDTKLLRYTLQIIKKIFPLRQRPQPLFKNRPCLNYDLGRCPGVCQQLITPEDYQQTLKKVAMIFQGRSGELVESLTQMMENAAAELNFEQAGLLRDQIKALQSLGVHQKTSLADDTISRDAIALAANDNYCSIQLFQIRAGALVGRLGFFSEAVGHTPGEILQRVLEEHYSQVEPVEIPGEVVVQQALPEAEIFIAWLSQRKGRKVNLVVPQRQGKAELIAMVEKNARYELEETQQKCDRQLQAMEDLADILQLEQAPKRIEGYDISHMQGSNAVASRVVFINGVPATQHYRHYKIQNPHIHIGHSDDFASLQEVIARRFRNYNPKDKPDVIMIDGGKGQLSSVVEILEQMNLLQELTVVSLAKQREEIYLPYTSEPLNTDPEQPGVQLLRRVRDEAHRFAVSFHRQQRLQTSRISYLEQIPGLGVQRQKQLLAHFHSLDYLREASVEQIMQVPGIGSSLAKQIYDYFHI